MIAELIWLDKKRFIPDIGAKYCPIIKFSYEEDCIWSAEIYIIKNDLVKRNSIAEVNYLFPNAPINNICEGNRFELLDSDSYAILQYDWADDYGMMASGDKDSYYNEEEKRRRAEESAEIIRKNNEAFALIEGTWETKDGSKRLEIVKETINEIEHKKIKLFNSEDDETYPETYPNEDVRADFLRIINPQLEPVVVEVEESDYLDHLTEYYLYNNKTEMECTLTEGRFYKQS